MGNSTIAEEVIGCQAVGYTATHMWGPTYSGRHVLPASYIRADVSGRIRDRDWRRIISIESNRGRKLSEMEYIG